MNTYKVWCPEYGHTEDNADAVQSDCHIHAAVDWVRHYEYHRAEFPVGNGASVVVHVSGDGTTRRYEITGHAEPVYDAKPLGKVP